MRVDGHGISLDVPSGWEARIISRNGGAPVLHVASFQLQDGDGDFGAAATGRMRAGDLFAALIEYRTDATLRPGRGLFAGARPAAPIAADFGSRQLQVTRSGQLGWQRFFTEGGRPYCLYEVIQPGRAAPAALVAELARVLATLELAPPTPPRS